MFPRTFERMTCARLLAASSVLLTTLAVAPSAFAQDAHGFGEKHQLILSADRLVPVFSFTSASLTRPRGNATETVTDSGSSFALLVGDEPTVGNVQTVPRVAFDFTIIDRLTLGGSFVLAFGLSRTQSSEIVPNQGGPTTTSERDAPKATLVGFAPRVGYIIPLGSVVAFWPRAGFAFYSRSQSEDVVNQGNVVGKDTDSVTTFSLDLDPQFAFVPIEHFFFTLGPIVNIPLTGSVNHEEVRGAQTSNTSFDHSIFHLGVNAAIGGWFNL